MECLAEMPRAPLDRRPRKLQRLGWDVGPAEMQQIQIGLCGQEVANAISAVALGLSSGGIVSSQENQELPLFASPPLREDDKDGHYVFAVGDNLTSRYRINAKMAEGTFGQVLECWDRERKEMVAVKIIRGIKKYSDAAMIEIGMLEQLGKYDKSRSSDSEESDNELDGQIAPYHLMEKRNLEKSILLELEREHHLKVQEEVRSEIAELEICHQNENQRTISAFGRLQKYTESRKKRDRRLDVQFQRRTAEVLDKHLSMVQRDYEQKSQIVERRIRDDAAIEEAKRKEKAIKEEKIRQEKARQEAEARQKEAAKVAAEAQKTAFEAAQKEAAEKEAAQKEAAEKEAAKKNEANSVLPGIKVFADNSALEAESRRRALHDQMPSNIHLSKEFSKYDRQIAKSISKLMPTTDSVKARANELVKALDGQDCPRPIACRLFANKIISIVKSRNTKDKTFGNLAFACGYVMLLVTHQVPDGMDYLLAEFNRVCIYTVPKHLHALNAQARNRDYYRLIGYQEENGQLESTESYLTHVVAYVKLYAAMLQTEIKGVRHPHGLAEGWKWLAMFLNALPATTATACALHAFLKMAGHALHKKYGSQFMKILDVISRCFLPALKEQGNRIQSEVVNNLQNYLNDKIYLQEPEGQYLAQQLLSKELFL